MEKKNTVKSRPAILWILSGTTEIRGLLGDDFCTHQVNTCLRVCISFPKEFVQYLEINFFLIILSFNPLVKNRSKSKKAPTFSFSSLSIPIIIFQANFSISKWLSFAFEIAWDKRMFFEMMVQKRWCTYFVKAVISHDCEM